MIVFRILLVVLSFALVCSGHAPDRHAGTLVSTAVHAHEAVPGGLPIQLGAGSGDETALWGQAMQPAEGGAAYLVSKAIKQAKVVGFAVLGMEAIYEFDIADMPVTVAVDSSGTSVHETGPKEWQAKIGKIPVVVA